MAASLPSQAAAERMTNGSHSSLPVAVCGRFFTHCSAVLSVLQSAVRSCRELRSLTVDPPCESWSLLWERGSADAHTHQAIPTPTQIIAMMEQRRALAAADPEFAPLTITLTILNDQRAMDELAADEETYAWDKWDRVQPAFKALVTKADDSDPVRFRLAGLTTSQRRAGT